MTENKFNLGIIGTGRMAKQRVKSAKSLNSCKINWICSRNQKRGENFAEKFGIKKVITDWEKGCNDRNIDGVIITAPNHLHEKMAVKALINNINVLLEYPMALSVKKSKKIIKAAKNSSGNLHIGLTHRLSAKHQAIKKELNTVGTIKSCNITQCSGKQISRWFDDKNKVGNVIIGSNYHYIDQILDWFGPVEWVNADMYEEPKKKIKKDIGSVMLKFKNDTTAYIIYARGWPEPGLGYTCKMIGEKGYIVENNGQPEKWSQNGKEKINYENNNSVLKDTKLFIDMIRGHNNTHYSIKDGLYGIKVAEAAIISAEKGARKYLE